MTARNRSPCCAEPLNFFLAADHAVAAEQADRHGRGEEDVVGEVRKQRVNVVGVPVSDPLLGECPGLHNIHVGNGVMPALVRQRLSAS